MTGMFTQPGRPELIAPARDREQLTMSLIYGADAVYFAGKRFGLRAYAGNFGSGELEDAVKICHSHGAKAYITCNAVMNNEDAKDLPHFLEELAVSGADAVIASDIGVIAMAQKYAPGIAIHISTQAGVFNFETALALHSMGASRVILARELTLNEIAEIRAKTPPALELEAFAHGSMCVSLSGRCLLSNYLAASRDGNRPRDANHGECAQPCRWKYAVSEERHPGEYYEITEEDGGTFIFNSRDLCMIDHIPEMLNAGITGFKIEGRMKSAYYAAVTTNAYRHALDAAAAGQELENVWRNEVFKVSHREYSTGFYFSHGGPGQIYSDSMYEAECTVAAIVEDCGADGVARLTQRNKFSSGAALELLPLSGEPIKFTAGEMKDAEGHAITSVPHPMMEFFMRLPIQAPKYSIVRAYSKC